MMNFLAAAAEAQGWFKMDIAEAGLYALLGYAVVFFGIVLLMIVVTIMGKIFVAAGNKKNAKPAPAPAAAPVVQAAPAPVVSEAAPGTAGQLKLYDTPPKTAAMIMAIVAEQTGKPLNELRFISIKEVK